MRIIASNGNTVNYNSSFGRVIKVKHSLGFYRHVDTKTWNTIIDTLKDDSNPYTKFFNKFDEFKLHFGTKDGGTIVTTKVKYRNKPQNRFDKIVRRLGFDWNKSYNETDNFFSCPTDMLYVDKNIKYITPTKKLKKGISQVKSFVGGIKEKGEEKCEEKLFSIEMLYDDVVEMFQKIGKWKQYKN